MRWDRLSNAMDFYSSRGYEPLDVPWVVSPAASASTKPELGVDLEVVPDHTHPSWGVLVASGEQSFAELMLKKKLKPGKYCTLTPCWRQEPVYHGGTRPWFMKVELILLGRSDVVAIWEVLDIAREFMDSHSMRNTKIVKTEPHNTWDLELFGIEVGSYGPRTMDNYTWVYGTGLAEPRFEWALKAGVYDGRT